MIDVIVTIIVGNMVFLKKFVNDILISLHISNRRKHNVMSSKNICITKTVYAGAPNFSAIYDSGTKHKSIVPETNSYFFTLPVAWFAIIKGFENGYNSVSISIRRVKITVFSGTSSNHIDSMYFASINMGSDISNIK